MNRRETSLGFFRITYENGMSQTKELITKNDSEYYRELSNLKSDIEIQIKGKKKKEVDPELKELLSNVKNDLKEAFPIDCFVIDSPMYNAMISGRMVIPEPSGNAGVYKMTFERLESLDKNNFEEND